jgi:hypothetical protein
VKWLPKVEYWINHITHEAIGYTPHEIMTGEKPNTTLSKLVPLPTGGLPQNMNVILHLAKKRLQKAVKNRIAAKDHKKQYPTYVADQQVLVREHRLSSAIDQEIHKFFLLYHGPYEILEVRTHSNTVVIDQEGVMKSENFKNIKRYWPPDPGDTAISVRNH